MPDPWANLTTTPRKVSWLEQGAPSEEGAE